MTVAFRKDVSGATRNNLRVTVSGDLKGVTPINRKQRRALDKARKKVRKT